MRTKIPWARKSQQPAAVFWTFSMGKFKTLIRVFTTDKKMIFLLQIKLLLTSSMRAVISLIKLIVDRK